MVVMSRLPRFITVPWLPVLGINLCGLVILLRPGVSKSTIRHELIHTPQWFELLIVGFPVVYVWDWLRARPWRVGFWPAYFRIRMEQEAFEYQDDETYLASRERFAWMNYTVTEPTDVEPPPLRRRLRRDRPLHPEAPR